ncbi:DUF3040 domain-containing protein [Nostocoides vanveenii]|jgi:hypothetical protein|uniref:Spore wall synthesis complex protein n=1 Tax=Nostocoides vanveenii TaxID=330835 RepID=A0ABN2L3R1_9MICO
MSLSEREQQLLDQMEQALYAEDPRFASQMQSVAARRSHTRHLIGLVGVLAGLGLVLLGVNTTWIVGAVGFVVMVAALAYAFAPPRKQHAPFGVVRDDGSVGSARRAGKGHKPGRGRRPQSGTFMERLEDRWDRRRGGW